MNIVGCDDLGALFLTIVTCVTVGATSVRPQRDRSLRKERPRIRLTIAWEANGLPYGIDVAYEFTYGAPRSYPRAPSLAALPQFTLPHPAGYRFEMITRCDHFLAMHTHRGECGFFVHIEQNDIIM